MLQLCDTIFCHFAMAFGGHSFGHSFNIPVQKSPSHSTLSPSLGRVGPGADAVLFSPLFKCSVTDSDLVNVERQQKQSGSVLLEVSPGRKTPWPDWGRKRGGTTIDSDVPGYFGLPTLWLDKHERSPQLAFDGDTSPGGCK